MRFIPQTVERASYAASQSRLGVIFRNIYDNYEIYILNYFRIVSGCTTKFFCNNAVR